MKTSPTVYLIKSILTVAQLPSAFNYDSSTNVPSEYQSQCCIAFFFFFEGAPLATGARAELLPPSHFTHKEWNEDQQLNSCSLGAFLQGQERDVGCNRLTRILHRARTSRPGSGGCVFFLHDVGPLRSERCSCR